MIQELLGGGKDINIFSSVSFPTPLPFTSPPPSSSSSTTACPLNSSIQISTPTTQSDSKTTLPNTSNSSCVANNTVSNNNNNNSETNSQKLRCPRCDSTNTKFCYYNNYNLTQPRHFCKTCRRYWTKGGTLRNVPIGGGCRKNKTVSSTTASSSPSSMSVSAFSKSSLGALFRSAKGPLSTEFLFPGLIGNGVLDPQSELSNPTFWPPQPPQNSHIRAFLNPNPNPTQGLFDPYGANGAPTPTHIGSSFPRSHQHQVLNGLPGQDNNMVQNGGNINSSNIMELYQKLKSSGGYGYRGHENSRPLNSASVVKSASTSLSPSPSLSSSMYMVSSALREGGAGENLGIPSWPAEFSTLPINGAFP